MTSEDPPKRDYSLLDYLDDPDYAISIWRHDIIGPISAVHEFAKLLDGIISNDRVDKIDLNETREIAKIIHETTPELFVIVQVWMDFLGGVATQRRSEYMIDAIPLPPTPAPVQPHHLA